MDYPTDFNKKRPGPWDDETFELTDDVLKQKFLNYHNETAQLYPRKTS